MSPLDREALDAAYGLRRIQSARLDIIVPQVVTRLAVAGTMVMTVVHLCRWCAS